VSNAEPGMFDLSTWLPALEKFGAVTHLTVIVYAGDRIVCGPFHATPLYTLFARHGYDPRIFDACAHRCVSQVGDRQAVVLPLQDGLAVVGAPLVLDGQVVGAAVAGYALVDFVGSSAIEHLARAAGVPFGEIWDIARAQQPIPERRLKLQGELLQVLGEAILRENSRTRGSETTAAALAAESAAKDDFLAVVSHELRTPLTPIIAWARILKLGDDPARARQAAEVIERNALLQARLVDDLLELTRARLGEAALDLRVHDLNEVLRSAIETIADDIQEKGLTLDVVEAREPLLVEVDEQRVQQILRNVLSNAVKFTPDGGRISVVLAQEGDMATLQIRDTGEGVAPEFISAAFELFRQQESGTRRRHAGLGIGLSLVKQLIELHGGRVALESEGVGLGTLVTLQFPLVSGSMHAPAARAPAAAPDLGGRRVLVVDDTEDNRSAIRMLLEELGAKVWVAADGMEGIEMIRGGTFDVVLCDLRMPRMDGFEFMQALRHLPEDTLLPPVIAMSGLTGSADHVRTAAAGFAGQVDKPFDEYRLFAAIEAVTARRVTTTP
jgi:signal transduction histidine kinase/ActR/RegA family two-component response regulator